MPVHIGPNNTVVDDKGKVHGRHGSREEARAQVTAMNSAMGYVPGVKPKRRGMMRGRT